MKKFAFLLFCAVLAVASCGKSDEDKNKNTAGTENTAVQSSVKNTAVVSTLTDKEFAAKFDKFSDPQKYYFCAAFAMGAMSVAKPATASAMVNYFMGLGVAEYGVGINDETYMAFDAGKNVFTDENLVNIILKSKICENIMENAADYARKRNFRVADLDELGKKEVEKAVGYIRKESK